jgi:hypothetical protein
MKRPRLWEDDCFVLNEPYSKADHVIPISGLRDDDHTARKAARYVNKILRELCQLKETP